VQEPEAAERCSELWRWTEAGVRGLGAAVGGVWVLHPAVPQCHSPCSGEPQHQVPAGVSKGMEKAAVPLLHEDSGSFHAFNGFPRSELANEPVWEVAGAEGPQTGAAEGGERLLPA